MKISDLFTNLDRFGVPVRFNFKGKTVHKTCWGGLLTFISIIILLLFGIEKTILMARNQNHLTSVYTDKHYP